MNEHKFDVYHTYDAQESPTVQDLPQMGGMTASPSGITLMMTDGGHAMNMYPNIFFMPVT